MAKNKDNKEVTSTSDLEPQLAKALEQIEDLQTRLVNVDSQQMAAGFGADNGPKEGDEIMIRSATIYNRGVVDSVSSRWIVLRDAYSIIETGELSKASTSWKWQSEEKVNCLLPVAVGGIIDIMIRNK